MRIHSVSMEGFGPYPGKETVDFDAFADDGLFLITGKTGSGKTSILDAICFGLFGSIPRYDGTAGEKVRSDYIGDDDVSRVEVEFSTGDGRYRIRREPEHHPEHRKTAIQQKAEIARVVGEGEEVLDTQVRNVGLRVADIVGLNAEQFLQVILLAQGKFQEFLVARSETRAKLLRTLFQTKRFDDYTEELRSRAAALHKKLERAAATISTDLTSFARESHQEIPDTVDPESGPAALAWAQPIRDEQAEAAEAAHRTATKTDKAAKKAAEALKDAERLHELQERRTAALSRKAELEDETEAIAAARESVKAARRAELVWQQVTAADTARTDHDIAATAHGEALAAFRSAHPEEPTALQDLKAQVILLTRQTGELDNARKVEENLSNLEETATQTTKELTEFEDAVTALPGERERLREQHKQLATQAAALAVEADRLPAARRLYDEMGRRLDAARKAERTAADLERAKQAQLAAGRDHEAAVARRNDLLERRLSGYAGELAAELVDGEPCQVCGSTTHPSPAVAAEDYPSDTALAAVEKAAKQADAAASRADDEVTRLETRWETETTEAAGSVVELEAEHAAAQAALRRATEADQEAKQVSVDQERLRHEIDAKSSEIEEAQSRRTELTSAQTLASREAKEAAAAVAEARGDYATVAERIGAIEAHLALAGELRDATTSLDSAVQGLRKAEASLTEALAEHGFDDAEAVRSARVPAKELSALETRVSDHEAGLLSVNATLADPVMEGLPEEPVDLTTPRQVAAEAEEQARQAHDVHVELRTRLATLDGLVTSIRKVSEESAKTQARYQVVNGLAAAARGLGSNTMKMMLETFVLTAELEEIVAAANTRLSKMSQGRYELQHSDDVGRGQSGLSLSVLDAHTGQGRPPESLSGGEKFQASLALALGLAEVVTSRNGGLRLETLFIDEGFGSLDSDTLETTMATLDSLREGGRTVGLISHVESMKETIPAKLYVDVVEGGGSTITTA